MMRLTSPPYRIVLDDDPTYTFGSADNLHAYGQVYRLDERLDHHSSRLAARVISTEDDSEVASCILGTARGCISIHEHLAVINGPTLIIAAGVHLVSLQLPTLDMNWKTETDTSICIGIYHASEQRCYISQGGASVARVAYDGRIEWTDGGSDFNFDGFEVSAKHVTAVDCQNVVYVWDIRTGKLLL